MGERRREFCLLQIKPVGDAPVSMVGKGRVLGPNRGQGSFPANPR